jgi:hypothetical protein
MTRVMIGISIGIIIGILIGKTNHVCELKSDVQCPAVPSCEVVAEKMNQSLNYFEGLVRQFAEKNQTLLDEFWKCQKELSTAMDDYYSCHNSRPDCRD